LHPNSKKDQLLVKQLMKKYTFKLVMLTLILAGLACNLPYQNPADDVPEVIEPAAGYREESRVVEDGLITLAVPDSYYVGSSISELDALVESIGGEQVDLTGLLGGAQADVLVWGYDTASAAAVPTSFVVVKNEEYAFMPLGLVSTMAGPLLGNNVEIIQESRLTLAGRDTLRWITVTTEAGLEFTQAVYIFKDSGVFYLIGFNADQQEVYAQLPNYDAIVASLQIEDLE
jgi:hypothetical protein